MAEPRGISEPSPNLDTAIQEARAALEDVEGHGKSMLIQMAEE